MSVNRKAVVIYGSTDLWDKADELRLFYRYISHNLCAKWVSPLISNPFLSIASILKVVRDFIDTVNMV